MKYIGSKARVANGIIREIKKFLTPSTLFVDAFVGGANIIDRIPHHKHKLAYDINPYLIALLTTVQKSVDQGWHLPMTVSEEEYYLVKQDPDNYDPDYVGLVGFCGSFGGGWWNSFARGLTDDGQPRDYANEAIRNLLKQAPRLKDIGFACCHYQQIPTPKGTVIYCDPPYKGVYNYGQDFDHPAFYDWCRKMATDNIVFLSEYQAPNDFQEIWQGTLNSNLVQAGTTQSLEKLFVLGVDQYPVTQVHKQLAFAL